MVIPGQTVYGDAVRTTINKKWVVQIVAAEGTANTTVVYAGGDQTVHGHALDTTLNGGYQYVHNGGTASGTVVNSDGLADCQGRWSGGFHHRLTRKANCSVNAGGTATHVTPETGWSTGHQYCGNGSWQQTVWAISRWKTVKADGVVLESGGSPGCTGRPFSAENTGG
ncbi:antigen 43, truncation [Escherichia coli]|uniref:Antigen 43, truncation n=1 Tax=Escherichia coli TaxID=562 RepID=A0A376LIF7_ECOLX|nr:antigen 43, truncation [Escherichia coli]